MAKFLNTNAAMIGAIAIVGTVGLYWLYKRGAGLVGDVADNVSGTWSSALSRIKAGASFNDGPRPDDPEALARRYPAPAGYSERVVENWDAYPDELVRGTRRDFIDSNTAIVLNARFNTPSRYAVNGAPPPEFSEGMAYGIAP
jgi:hypothetical protein